MLEEIKQSAEFIRKSIKTPIDYGVILGSGLGQLTSAMVVECIIPYSSLTGFPVSTVAGHEGAFYIGELGGSRVLMMKGRFHYYEGYNMQQVVMPVRVMHLLGIKKLLVSNAAGGVNANYSIGDIMLIKDHINLFPDNPLRGKNLDELGPRFPDMSEAYRKSTLKQAFDYSLAKGYPIQQGVYAGLTGPTYETPSEYKYLSILGADAVGMSTVPEIIAAKHCGMDCFGASVITDLGVEGKIEEISHEMVTQAAENATPILTDIFVQIIKNKWL